MSVTVETQPAFALGARADHDANTWRRMLASLVRHPGVSESDGFEATAVTGQAVHRVSISSGFAFVAATAASAGMYHVASDGDVDLDFSGSDPSQDRVDLVVAQVDDASEGGNDDEWVLEVVEGTPGGSAPATPDAALALWEVTVQAGSSELDSGDLDDVRVVTGVSEPVGTIVSWMGPEGTTPAGHLVCDGRDVSRSTYSDLFDLVGERYGAGDGSTTFGLPDLRGRFPLGKDDMGQGAAGRVTEAAADSVGGTGGAESATVPDTPQHDHSAAQSSQGGAHTHSGDFQGIAAVNTTSNQAALGAASFTDSQDHDHAITVHPVGSGGSHENVHPYLTTIYLIVA